MRRLCSRLQQAGWPGSMYGVSKLLESTYSRVLAQRLAPQGIDVNACCPGASCLTSVCPASLRISAAASPCVRAMRMQGTSTRA